MTGPNKTLHLDRAAIGLSVLCMLHCLALPMLLVVTPALAALPIADERFHLFLVFLVIPTSSVALFIGCRHHRDHVVLLWALTGVSLLVFTAFMGAEVLGETGEKVFTLLGATGVAIGHIRNYRLCRSADCPT